MTYLLEAWGNCKGGLSQKDLAVFLDYDGTLAPISEMPNQAVMAPETRAALTGLSGMESCHVAVISGRRLEDVEYMVGIQNITYIGNHGFEVDAASHLNFESLLPLRYQLNLAAIKGLLSPKLESLKGVWVEDKGLTMAVHFRLASKSSESVVRKVFFNICSPYLYERSIRVMEGKKVLEVRPSVNWDKGRAAAFFLHGWQRRSGVEHMPALYIGDDLTDESAFKFLRDICLTVRVGESQESCAGYFLKKQEEVPEVLDRILTLREQGDSTGGN